MNLISKKYMKFAEIKIHITIWKKEKSYKKDI